MLDTKNSPTAPPSTGNDAAAVLRDIANGWPALTANQLRKLPILMTNGRQHDVGWVHRIFGSGKRGTDGARVRLEFARGPSGTRISTEAAVSRWMNRLNGIGGTPEIETNKSHARADARLARLGM